MFANTLKLKHGCWETEIHFFKTRWLSPFLPSTALSEILGLCSPLFSKFILNICISFFFFFFFFNATLLFFFNWRTIALQNFVVFCDTSTRISHVSFLPKLPPHPTLLDCHRALVWVPWVIQQIPIGCWFYILYCKFPCYWESQFLGRLIRSLGFPRRKEESGILKEEKRTNIVFFSLYVP